VFSILNSFVNNFRLQSESERSPKVVAIDLGVSNMAWVTMDLRNLQFQSCHLSALKHLKPSSMTSFSECSLDVLAQISSDQHTKFVIEQQIRSHNTQCMILEAQLHALLYPRAITISAATVAREFQLKEIGAELSSNKGKLKKKAAVSLVQYLIDNTDWFSSSVVETFKQAKKRDDVSDAILMALIYCLYSRRQFRETIRILRLQTLADIHQ
jgi:hypothetical protein